ncbi:MAG: EutN/CcmL family microcompartment protein [Planctomycetaceae bacterium]
MQLSRVIGKATATVKHPSLNGWRMLILQPLLADGGPDGEPQLAVDPGSAGVGDLVIAAADGSAAKEIMESKNTPVRWVVLGQTD